MSTTSIMALATTPNPSRSDRGAAHIGTRQGHGTAR